MEANWEQVLCSMCITTNRKVINQTKLHTLDFNHSCRIILCNSPASFLPADESQTSPSHTDHCCHANQKDPEAISQLCETAGVVIHITWTLRIERQIDENKNGQTKQSQKETFNYRSQ